MKKILIYISLLCVIFTVLSGVYTSAREVSLVHETFEDGEHSFTSPYLNGSKVTYAVASDSTQGKVLAVTQKSNYADAGVAVSLAADIDYSFSYKIKAVSYADGTAYDGTETLKINTNILFADANASNSNHTIGATVISPDGKWHSISGSYTPSSSVIASDADPTNARFGIYINPCNGKGNLFMIDDVKLTYTDNQPADGTNYFANGSFEDTENIEIQTANGTSCTITPGDLDASDGIYSVRVSCPSNYGHIGIPVTLEAGRTYEYSYDCKLIGDYSGNGVTSPIKFYTNFVFADTNASSGRNHIISACTATSSDGWHSVSGSYTPDYTDIAADANLQDAWFTVYPNATPNGGAVWLIDNIVLSRKPLYTADTTMTLPDLISDNMLVQMGKPIPVWGAVSSSELLTVTLTDGINIVSQATLTPENGVFDGLLPAVDSYYKKLSLVFSSGDKTIATVENVAIGELWHFSGQSNMTANSTSLMPDIIPSRDMPDIRYFCVGANGAGKWVAVSRSNMNTVGAVAYKTMETIYNGLDCAVAVGGLNTAIGGKKMANYMGICQYSPTGGDLYNSRIAPITKLPVKGHFWYQGESDTKNTDFVNCFEALIASWRTAWNDNEQPFIFVQLPRSAATIPDWWGGLDSNGNPTRTSTYNYSDVHMWQYELYDKMKDHNVSMIVAMDTTTRIDEQKSVENLKAEDPLHPRNKAPIGIRLGNTALHNVYDKTDIPHLSPMPEDIKMAGKHIFIKYSGCYDGLETNDGNMPELFEIVDAKGEYYTPDKVEIISRDTIMLYSDAVTEPESISYFYEGHFVDMSKPFSELSPNFTNSAGLPASPFTYEITQNDIITAENYIAAYNSATGTATLNVAQPGNYVTIFADYHSGILENIDIITFDAQNSGIHHVAQNNNQFTLDKGDKICLWYSVDNMKPVCKNLIIN